MAEPRSGTEALDANRNIGHASYKVIGILAWAILAASIVGAATAPRQFLIGVRLFAFYLLARLIINTAFYLVGLVRCRRWSVRAAARHARS